KCFPSDQASIVADVGYFFLAAVSAAHPTTTDQAAPALPNRRRAFSALLQLTNARTVFYPRGLPICFVRDQNIGNIDLLLKITVVNIARFIQLARIYQRKRRTQIQYFIIILTGQ